MKEMKLMAYSVNYSSTRFYCTKCDGKDFQIIFFNEETEEYLCTGCLILKLDAV